MGMRTISKPAPRTAVSRLATGRGNATRFASVVITVLAAVASTSSPAFAGQAGQVNLFLGQTKNLENDNRHNEFGFEASVAEEDWPVAYALDLLFSNGTTNLSDPAGGSVLLTGGTFELDAGVRKTWRVKKGMLPYLGGGLGYIGADVEASQSGLGSSDAKAATIGFWAGTGVLFRLGGDFCTGLAGRYSYAKVDLHFKGGVVTRDVNAGGLHYGLVFGGSW